MLMGHTDIARSTILFDLFSEIGEQDPDPATLLLVDVFQHLPDPFLVAGLPLFIHRGRKIQVALLLACLPIDDVLAPFVGNITDAGFGESDQDLIHLMFRQLTPTGHPRFVDEDIVGKETGIETQKGLDHPIGRLMLTGCIQGITGGQEHQAGAVLLLIRVFDVASQFQEFQGMMGLQQREFESRTKLVQLELMDGV